MLIPSATMRKFQDEGRGAARSILIDGIDLRIHRSGEAAFSRNELLLDDQSERTLLRL